MPTVLANPFLTRPSTVWLWDWYLASSFPITFPWTFDAPPFRFSSLDLYPTSVLADVLYEGRLLEKPQLTFQSPDVFGAIQEVDQVTLRLIAAPQARVRVFTSAAGGFDPTGFDPSGFDVVGAVTSGILLQPTGIDLHAWVTSEHRGKLLIGHLIDLDAAQRTVAVQQNLFRGETLALSDDPASVSVVARAFDLASLTTTVPATLVDTGWAPYAPTESLGQPVPHGIGIGRRIPCLPVKAQTDDTELFQQPFTATASTDLVTIPSHFLNNGDGPFRLTGTLPAGLLPAIDYWAILVDDDNIRLALTQGDAVTGTFVDITADGAGIMTGGLASNLSEDYDLVVIHGNAGIVRVWEDDNAQGSAPGDMPDTPVTYEVQHRTYRPGGRYATSIRFQDQLDGISISADILRVYPDVDDLVVGEWKWLTGFGDDVGGHDAFSAPEAPETLGTFSLVPTHQGYGLGGLLLDGNQWLATLPGVAGNPALMPLDNFTVEVECIPDAVSAGSTGGLVTAPLGGSTIPAWNLVPGWNLYYLESTQQLSVFIVFQDGSTWSVNTASGSMPRGRPMRVTMTRDGGAGTTSIYLGRTLALTDTRAAKIAYGTNPSATMRFGVAQGVGFRGVLGWIRYSSGLRSTRYIDNAYWLWRRNPIEYCREVAEDARRLTNGASFDAAALAIDGIQGGTLKADGYQIAENVFSSVLQSLAPFRDLAFSIGADLRLAVDVAAAPTTVQGMFGHGDDYANLLELPTRARASLTEAPRSISVRFRRPRMGGAGPFGGYAMQIIRQVLGVGQDAAPLELPFVDSTVTADQIADFRAKRTRTRDQVVSFSLGHEGRLLTKGGTIRLNVPSMAITDLDLETISLAKGAERVDGRGVPTNASDFVYTPQPLPADPVDRTLQITDLGDQRTLLATLANARLTLQVALSDAYQLFPTGPAYDWNFFGNPPWANVVGATTEDGAIDEVNADDIGSYVEATAGNQNLFCYFAQVPLLAATIDAIQLRARARTTTTTASLTWEIETGDPHGSYVQLSDTWPTVVPLDWRTFTGILLPQRTAGVPWTLAQVNTLAGRLVAGVSGGNHLQLTQFVLIAYVRRELPLEAGFVRYWIRGPSASAPPTPVEADPSQFTALDLAPQVTDLTGTSGQKFWIWAGIYDEFGRLIVLVGPTSVTVP